MKKLINRTITSALIVSSLGLAVNAKYISDSQIKDAVDDLYNHYPEIDRRVNVTVNDGYVTLDGRVDKYSLKNKAEDLVEDIAGVKDVNNKITLEEDIELKRRLETAIFLSMKLDSDSIRVYVEDGKVTLEGSAQDLEAKELATEKAYKAGAIDVENDLSIM